VEFILTGVKNAFDNFSGALSTVQGWFETLSGWVSTAYGHVKDFIGFISNVKLPDWISKGVSAGVSFVGDLIGAGGGKDKKGGKKSHYSGLDSVPYDGYSARLHKGERVMTARENKGYSEGNGGGTSGGISIAKLADQIIVREDADIDAIAYKLAKAIERQRAQVS
ncbi:phage tail tape measure protein, partial [Lysinibacillus xylanilyticus]